MFQINSTLVHAHGPNELEHKAMNLQYE